MFHTIRITTKQKCPAAAYLKRNTAGTRAVRNTALFFQRNVMTGLRKSPEERTHNETEVLHYVFTGIQKANALKEARMHKKLASLASSGLAGRTGVKKALKEAEPFPYPTARKWLLSYEQLEAILRLSGNQAYRECVAKVAQKAVKMTVESMTSWLKSLKDWKQYPRKYEAMPRIPGYIRSEESTAHFTNQAARLEIRGGRAYLVFSVPQGWDAPADICIGPASLFPGKYMKPEVKPLHGRFCLLITYKTEEAPDRLEVPEHPRRIAGTDLGVDNFAAVMTNTDAVPLVIDGKWLKSINQWYNREKARLVSCQAVSGQGTKTSSCKKAEPTRRLAVLSRKREDLVRDFFYKAAHRICRYCADNQVEVIVIGHNRGQKQGISIGKANNQNFTSIPHARFIRILETVAMGYGIPVIQREESYTSKASLLDNDPLPVYGEIPEGETPAFSGKRVKRGLYCSADGTLINADLNGAGNIIRKAYPYAFEEVRPVTGQVLKVTRDELSGAKPEKSRTAYRPRKSAASRIRHEKRKEARRILTEAWKGAVSM